VILAVLRIRIQDPGSGDFFIPGTGSGSGIRDEKNPEAGSGLSIPDLIFENLVSVFLGKNTYILLYGSGSEIWDLPGSGMEKDRSGINIPDPQHWILVV